MFENMNLPSLNTPFSLSWCTCCCFTELKTTAIGSSLGLTNSISCHICTEDLVGTTRKNGFERVLYCCVHCPFSTLYQLMETFPSLIATTFFHDTGHFSGVLNGSRLKVILWSEYLRFCVGFLGVADRLSSLNGIP